MRMKITREMLDTTFEMQYNKFYGKEINLLGLKENVNDFKTITYNPKNYDKFMAFIDTKKKFIHVYEFKNNSDMYDSKYIHAIYDENENIITHIDYSINTYSSKQYKDILVYHTPEKNKSQEHKKIWRIDGKIKIENFYKILLTMFASNEEFIKELFKI